MQQVRIARPRRRTQRPSDTAPLVTRRCATGTEGLDELLDRIERLLRGVT
jgi:hypothetical protein